MLLQFKIQIKNIMKPPVWRRVLIPAQFSFDKFHKVIQAAFGWENYHLYQFSPKGWGSTPSISLPNPNPLFPDDMEGLNSTKVKLQDIFTKEKQKYTYIYDFGDDWLHEITLERISDENALRASCIGGSGACPPEDCGGWPGYMGLKEILADPNDPEHEEMLEWLGLESKDYWNPTLFSLELADAGVSFVK